MIHPSQLPLIPLPNGRANVELERMPLPKTLCADAGPFEPAYLKVFARRAGVALGGAGPAVLRCAKNEGFPAESYRLKVSRERGIQIEAADGRGLCWALTTLAALRDENGVPYCDIVDAPRFGHRGILLDSVRHFFPVGVVKELIETLSMAKINVLHWHLSDDQGWRVESKRFPQLHEQCAPDYYTQDEIKDIVAFALARGVEIIPEIDLPGHTTSILAAYPGLSCSGKRVALGKGWGIYAIILCPGKDEVFDFLLPLLEEIAALFPSERFHLGGDEAPKGEWKACERCQKRMRTEGLANEEELQGWFTARLADHMRGLGKRVICWNESLQDAGLREKAPDLIGQYWAEMRKEGPTRRFWERGGELIFSDYLGTYLDQPHGTVQLKQTYAYGPGLPGRGRNDYPALGLEACLWTEYIPDREKLALQAFPRAYALAEAAWTQPLKKDYGQFRGRLALWLARRPGMGFTPPEQADMGLRQRWRERKAFLLMQKNAPKPENSAKLDEGGFNPAFFTRWLKSLFS
ncbi:MAG: family 20 glycosylhydrolase [Oscillospiraceae bacterium]|jgi:hexosaminidase|nr:family 20 glycosylhydrolase [Oscillospiraceae bacterium]